MSYGALDETVLACDARVVVDSNRTCVHIEFLNPKLVLYSHKHSKWSYTSYENIARLNVFLKLLFCSDWRRNLNWIQRSAVSSWSWFEEVLFASFACTMCYYLRTFMGDVGIGCERCCLTSSVYAPHSHRSIFASAWWLQSPGDDNNNGGRAVANVITCTPATITSQRWAYF